MAKFSVDAIRNVANEHRKKFEKKKVAAAEKIEVAAVSSDSIMSCLLGIPEGPVVSPITYSKQIAPSHPVHKKDYHVRLMDGPQWNTYFDFQTMVSSVNTLLQAAETEEEKASHQESISKLNLSRYMFVISACLCDKNGNLLLNNVKEEKMLEDYWASPAKAKIFDEIWTAAMVFNGLMPEESKEEAKN